MARKGGKDRGVVEKPKGSGKWWVRLFVNYRERWFRAENKTQAKVLYGRLKAEIREGKYFPEKSVSIKDITLRAAITRHLSGSTNRNLQGEKRYGRYWNLLLGKRLLTDITTNDCRQLQSKLMAKGKWKPATINRYFAFLRHVLMVAVKDGMLNRNPVSGLKFFPEAYRIRFFTDEELTNLYSLIDKHNWKIIAFAIETGLRRSEQFKLRWDQISFDSRTLTIPLPKGGRTRHVPLTQGALNILRTLDSLLVSPWVFPGLKNPMQPMDSRAYLRRVFEPALRKVGIKDASWHVLRHTTASRLVMAGVPLPTVQQILGHRDIQTTLRYSHLSPSHVQAAIERGSLAKLGIGTGSKTGREGERFQGKDSQVLDFMARPEGESSNSLFQILEEWNRILQGSSLADAYQL